ncbi:MAG: hypothetical protein M1378_04505 [Bacteroidetes bacterium]|jgi:hypothetical protein|nr:hypothetical protein [Bacteroidota bacterium]
MKPLNEILSIGQVSLKGMGASIDELARQISKTAIRNYNEGKLKRKTLDYLSVCQDVLTDCYCAIADSMEDEQ